jgi:hypothetical protein
MTDDHLWSLLMCLTSLIPIVSGKTLLSNAFLTAMGATQTRGDDGKMTTEMSKMKNDLQVTLSP